MPKKEKPKFQMGQVVMFGRIIGESFPAKLKEYYPANDSSGVDQWVSTEGFWCSVGAIRPLTAREIGPRRRKRGKP